MSIEATGTDDLPSNVLVDPDLTVSFHRPLVGDRVRLEARTRCGPSGMGSAESALWDTEGQIGRSVQNPMAELTP